MNFTGHCLGGSSLVRKRDQPDKSLHQQKKKKATHHHTENESSLFSALSVSVCPSLCLCLSLSLSLSLCLSLLSCGVVVVMCCVVLCCVVCVNVCVLVCGTLNPRVSTQHVSVCTFKTSLVCTGTTRTHVETCVRVVPVQTGTF